ncbi:2-isopropylmalate synthase [Candidatus Rariloculus sp.]|uniref:2-isopropylmalate synthase n=1 Tax=Candidatus Rariloculus sp. TaxID=3101265 RepID=UPI003D0BD1AD
MSEFDHRRYRPFEPIGLSGRTWPDQVITRAPDWCSVDLRDGNQALVQPMSVSTKLELFELLVELGFKEIEIGFPSASETEFEFARLLIDKGMIPESVTIQVLTQAREDLVARTFESLIGVERAIVHVYNSTSAVQREQVFRATKDEITKIAVNGARWVSEYADQYPDTDWTFEYSPESFSGTEPEFAVEVCNAVLDVWKPEIGQPVVINLPATVEMATPNVFADQVEYFCRHVAHREHIRVSLHTHNDRGCAIAASELGLMAGADRIEGTLFGNGERTGNMDIVTMAMNLYTQGVDPRLDLSDMARIIRVYTRCTDMPVHARHPWAGELVYAAFSGSHQDAIRKSMAFHGEHGREHWDVVYLPVDPEDLGRRYEEVVRINSQSGKGGVALVLERDHGIKLPKWLHPVVSRVVQRQAEASGSEVPSKQVRALFESAFVVVPDNWQLKAYSLQSEAHGTHGQFRLGGDLDVVLNGQGQGLIEALVSGIRQRFAADVSVMEFDERALSAGTDAKALASVIVDVDGERAAACCIDEDSSFAVLQATLSAIGRGLAAAEERMKRAV